MSHKNALLSVSDKTGIVELATTLIAEGYQLLSTGGTATLLKTSGLAVRDVSEYTGFPEMMDGRIKTLHPRVHGGLLARRDNAQDTASMRWHGIEAIDIVVINLYPFAATVESGAEYDECVEQIDIGGPAMIRAAAKNHAHVTVVTDPQDYTLLSDALTTGGISPDLRKTLAAKAFAATAAYDAIISNWFYRQLQQEAPQILSLPMHLIQPLRYGENSHQRAAFYRSDAQEGTLAAAIQVHGKELSFNNINDTDAAWKLVCEFNDPAIAIIKHANPCGVAVDTTIAAAYDRAFQCDSQSAYGGIIAANRIIDAQAAQAISQQFAEVIIAPAYEDAALEIFAKKKNIRLLHTNGALLPKPDKDIRSVSGGYLVQDADTMILNKPLHHVSKRLPDEQEIADMVLAFTIAKHVKSNAIVLVKDGMAIGIGAGQMSRVDSVRVACQKAQAAGLDTQGAALASDAFFPFDDNVHQAAKAGITSIIQPGGSIRDDEVISAANQYDMVMSFTGIRHFRH